jgi:Response regulator receiver domain
MMAGIAGASAPQRTRWGHRPARPPEWWFSGDAARQLHAGHDVRLPRFHALDKARDGREALDLMKMIVPDLMILDLRMPEFTGEEVRQPLRQSAVISRIPVLIISGFLARPSSRGSSPGGAGIRGEWARAETQGPAAAPTKTSHPAVRCLGRQMGTRQRWEAPA